jgi:hypothetical protein
LAVAALALAQTPAGAPQSLSYEFDEFGTIPRPAALQALLRMPAVQEELKLTVAQKKAHEAIMDRHFERIQKARRDSAGFEKSRRTRRDAVDVAAFKAALQEALKPTDSRKKGQEPIHERQTEKARPDANSTRITDFQTAREAILKETQAAILGNLEPRQRDRLQEIQLQAQGPLAFSLDDSPFRVLAQSRADLQMSNDQLQRIRAIVEDGDKVIDKVSTFPIPRNPNDGPLTIEAVRKLVATPEFLAAKEKARKATREAIDHEMRRIDQVLTESQRAAYRTMLGRPFDLSKLGFEADRSESERDADIVARNAGGGGQRADPNFNSKAARPAYAGTKHPRVLFDEAHNNFHTAGGRYKPFADLISSDGYQVRPSTEKFTKQVLQHGDILVIANAEAGGDPSADAASQSAFTQAECNAVRDWVNDGGSLLLITDHEPFGSASAILAQRFGVVMSKTTVSDPTNSSGDDTSLVFSRDNKLLGDHSITQGRDPSEQLRRVQTFTGQSLRGPEGSVAFLKLAATAVDGPLDGSETDGKKNQSVPAAGRSQGLALSFGKGRVVVLGEAAQLSAQVAGLEPFGMNVPGIDNRQMALNIMHWLSGLLDPLTGTLKKAG